MGRKRKPKPQPPRGRAGAPDDFFEFNGGYMARFGRFIEMAADRTPEEHLELREAFIAQIPQIEAEQNTRRERLLSLLRDSDPVTLLAQASLSYSLFDPDTYRESRDHRSPAHIEYLALQLLGEGMLAASARADGLGANELAWATAEAVDLIQQMFDGAAMLNIARAARELHEHPEDQPRIEYTLEARQESLGVRGAGYPEHVERVVRGCFDPFAAELRALLGFTAADAVAIAHTVPSIVTNRLRPVIEAATAIRADIVADVKRARRHKRSDSVPEWLWSKPPNEAKSIAGQIALGQAFAAALGVVTLTPEEIAETSGLPVDTVSAFLHTFACAASEFNTAHHAFPTGAHPLTTRPFICLPQGYVLPAPSSLLEALRPSIEDALRGADPELWDRYVDGRGRFVEQEAVRLLSDALPGSSQWQALGWAAADGSGSDLDGLVHCDDLGLRLQCKAGRMTAAARRGAPARMLDNLRKLIADAAQQHSALATAIEKFGVSSLGFTREVEAALQTRWQVEVIVCLDDVTVWATEAHELRAVGVLESNRPVPWVLSLMDLMAVTDLLQGCQLAHYLLRRQRVERDGRVSAHDELDWVGHYIAEGLFFDRYFEGGGPDKFRLMSYTEPIDSWYFTRAGVRKHAAPKPEQPIPPRLAWLIGRLESERPRHWLTAAVALLDGDDVSRQKWASAIAHISERVKEVGWSNASMTYYGRLGITIFVDMRFSRQAVFDGAQQYATRKATETDVPNWVLIAESRNRGLDIVLVERDATIDLGEVFLQPEPLHADEG